MLFRSLVASLVIGAKASAKPKAVQKPSPAPQSSRSPQAAQPIQWVHDLKTAHRFSVATGRPMLIVFGASWCTYCKKLETETLGHPSLGKYINATFIPVQLDLDKEQRVAQILEVKSLPTCVILSPGADLLGTIEGYVKASEFAQVLKQSVDFQKTLEDERAVAMRRRK